jgi:hypothetical protein
MSVGQFYGNDIFGSDLELQYKIIQTTVKILSGTYILEVAIDFSQSVIPGTIVNGDGIMPGTVILDVVSPTQYRLSNPVISNISASSLVLYSDGNTGLGIGTMEIGKSFKVG